MTAGWFVFSLLAPPSAAVAAAVFFRGRLEQPVAAIVLNALAPGSGLAAIGRPTLEIVLGVLYAQASLLVAGGVSSAAMLIPIAIVAGLWASFYTPLNPIVLASSGPIQTVATTPGETVSLGRSSVPSILPVLTTSSAMPTRPAALSMGSTATSLATRAWVRSTSSWPRRVRWTTRS